MWTTEQNAVINSPLGHTVVYAAPGSGKTAVLTERISRLIGRKQLEPRQLLAMTFTRQAALEMRSRIRLSARLSQKQTESLSIGTFHAQLFHQLLDEVPDIPVILREREQMQFIRAAVRKTGYGASRDTKPLTSLVSRLTAARSSWPPRFDDVRVADVYSVYQALKMISNRWDFDDILAEYYARLVKGDLTLKRLQDVRWIFVDEFQDTNHLQWQILSELVARLGAVLFVVGDEDQSIYGFRGANPKWLINFSESYPEAASHILSVNFRSDTSIIHHANQVIRHNRVRVDKQSTAIRTEPGDCVVVPASNEQGEALNVKAALRHGGEGDARQVAVLARTRQQLYGCWGALQGQPSSGVGTDVSLHTFHDAKGKEWDEVHIIGAVAYNPYLAQLDDTTDSTEEERRLFYVAMTRARHRLVIHYPHKMRNIKVTPSAFLLETGLCDGRANA